MNASTDSVISIQNLNKTYSSGYQALQNINLEIRRGEIFALLGPNGAGKTTLISIICGIVNPTSGSVKVNGFDIIKNYRQTRKLIGLVPQELTTGMFEKVIAVVSMSRGLFGKASAPEKIERVLKSLSLLDKKNEKIMTLSGGMKRRLMIAKALAHEPDILFLDEPTAGVDVGLRREMWDLIRELRANGVTIILTTHYIEEAEEMADRVGVINGGKIIVVEEKTALMEKLGKKQLILQLNQVLKEIPADLRDDRLALVEGGNQLVYTYHTKSESTGITELIQKLRERGIDFKDLQTKESSLEDIFVNLVGGSA